MEMFRKTSLTPLRSRAWSTAAETAAPCTVPNDSAIRETSVILLVAGLRRLGGHVHVVAPPQLFDHARQSFVGHLADAVVQPAQVPGDLAAEPHQQEDRGHHGGQPQAAGQDGLE